ncbi:(2Fe-2S)-binding protein [Acidaminobacter sp. JC074]|uniref:(2Fe-2S)-binding protein n=1 Tax=Acidaminobacter sp. JC074 TaxID=2530199 RepID=UPI001F0F3417|nr:(2Fe-2S)-binding protein [Acidaminobacter sp. JC074]MCH4890097.1 (2Fe-2S)-binding protein [Acidaminobacter sp. JC074]
MIAYSGYQMIELDINGHVHQVLVKPNETLLRVLREKVGYTGPKGGCENGDCGACTVLIDDKPMKACMILAVSCTDNKITTIEGLENTEIQEAFVDKGGFQCGYCTSGFLMNAYAMLRDNPDIDESGKKIWLDANLCRCTGYDGIKDAVDAAQKKIKEKV